MPTRQGLHLFCLIHLLAGAVNAQVDGERRLVWQPVQRYLIHRQGGSIVPLQGPKRLNSFTSYTHLGTDFGFHGPAEHEIVWVQDEISVNLRQQPDAWAGMWHSLAGQGNDAKRTMDFARVFPEPILPEFQPRVNAVRLDAAGRGRIKLEIKNAADAVTWTQMVTIDDDVDMMFVFPVASGSHHDAKFLVWTAEPGSDVRVDGIYLGMEMPGVAWDVYAFLTSYAKLLRCYTVRTGFVRDRAHLDDGSFDSVSATGMFVLATAAAAQSPVALVKPEYARWVMSQTHEAVRRLEKARGLLPHFVSESGGVSRIHPGTEYSSIDTAIYCQAMLLAARMLGNTVIEAEVAEMVRHIDFQALRLPSGHVSHGMKDDGKTLLQHGWRDWGGETALIMLLEHAVDPSRRIPPVDHPGHAWQGSGFITELQSLFHPDFDSDEADAVDGIRWRSVRRRMQDAQRAYFPRSMPQSLAARLGIFGLSAGENEAGNGYHVGGTELPDQRLIHPHYILMSATMAEKSDEVLQLLQRMEKSGFFLPWGMVENLTADGTSELPMEGALNAAFEALGAYHLLAKHRRVPDAIYRASQSSEMVRAGMRLFFNPSSPSQ